MGFLSAALAEATDDGIEKKGALDRIFWELPVPLDVFVQDSKYLNNPPLSPVQFDAVQHIERIYYSEMYELLAQAPEKDIAEYWSQDVRLTNLIALQWGKGSGKDHVARMASLRVAYLLLCMHSPQNYFGMPEQDTIHLLNIAFNSGQANNAFFKPMTKAVARGWFRDYAEPTQNVIVYDKNIEAISGHSNADSQEGLNIMLGVADEIDAFKSKSEMVGLGKRAREASTSAETILDMLKTSASTRFPDTYKRVAISFPRYLGSTIQKLTEEARRDIEEVGPTSIYYFSGPLATWEVNPRVSGKEKYASDYRKDPIAAAAKYECKPHRATAPYFRNFYPFRQAVSSERQPVIIDYVLTETIAAQTGARIKTWEPKFTFDPEFKPIQGANYAMHADLAIKGDRAGISMSHVTKYEEREETIVAEDGEVLKELRSFPYVHNDFTIAFESDATSEPPREIQIRWARELCYALRKRGFNIIRFTFDGFQSVDSMQMLERQGIETDRVSTDLDEGLWKSLGDMVSEARLDWPFSQLLMDELEGLEKPEKKVDHPPGGSKDLADALAGSVAGALEIGGAEDPEGSTVAVGAPLFFSGVNPVNDPLVDSLELMDFNFGMSMPFSMDW